MIRKCSLKSLEREKYFSKQIHSFDTPLLISSKLLRKRGCGQVDIASIHGRVENMISIFEVKSSGSVSYSQRKRLFNTCALLTGILKVNTKIRVL